MLTWEGLPMTRRKTPGLQAHFEILADALAAPGRAWWPTLDAILALPETHDCCPLEWAGEDG